MKLTFIELPLFTSLVTQITDDHFLLHLYQGQVGEPHPGPGASAEGRC
jgi:hypothetical protein